MAGVAACHPRPRQHETPAGRWAAAVLWARSRKSLAAESDRSRSAGPAHEASGRHETSACPEYHESERRVDKPSGCGAVEKAPSLPRRGSIHQPRAKPWVPGAFTVSPERALQSVSRPYRAALLARPFPRASPRAGEFEPFRLSEPLFQQPHCPGD